MGPGWFGFEIAADISDSTYGCSTSSATASPPPRHRVAMPRLALRSEPCTRESHLYRADRRRGEVLGRLRVMTVAPHARERFQATALEAARAREHQRGRAVVDLGGVGRGHGARGIEVGEAPRRRTLKRTELITWVSAPLPRTPSYAQKRRLPRLSLSLGFGLDPARDGFGVLRRS
jgi:hypothetical protein